MCGIIGVVSKSEVDPSLVNNMTRSLDHRGPDAHAIYISNNKKLALGHTRLSVIDLSTTANQPMHSSDGKFTIIFNGEIYNFKNIRKEIQKINPAILFRTNSDTETILYAFSVWREKMVDKLEGMFAIAIFDHDKMSLFLFRDRMGKKPLFYYQDNENFIFASEIKALLRHPAVAANRLIHPESITRFLHLGFIPEPNTIYQSIKKFPAGHWGEIHENRIILKSYWTITNFNKNDKVTLSDAKSELKNCLLNAVEKRMISDVPLGTFLSGGTDSSLITAMASLFHKEKLKTFSIGFEENKFDESIYAQRVAKELNTDHYAYTLKEREAVNIVESYLNHFDEPFADTSAIPTMLVSKLARKEVIVVLSGDGGDELFMGYGSYDWAIRLNHPMIRKVQQPVSVLLRSFGNDRLKRIGNVLEKVEKQRLASHIFSQEQYFFSDREIDHMLINPESYNPFIYFNEDCLNLSPSEQQALFDIQFYLKDDLLVKIDRASMFHSLECRCPLLDHHVVELAMQLPEQFKRRRGVRKWILKELLKEFLPTHLINRPKWGFSVPLTKWLKGDLRHYQENFLNSSLVEELGIVKKDNVNTIIKRFNNGENHLYNRLWVLIVIHKWLKENG